MGQIKPQVEDLVRDRLDTALIVRDCCTRKGHVGPRPWRGLAPFSLCDRVRAWCPCGAHR